MLPLTSGRSDLRLELQEPRPALFHGILFGFSVSSIDWLLMFGTSRFFAAAFNLPYYLGP